MKLDFFSFIFTLKYKHISQYSVMSVVPATPTFITTRERARTNIRKQEIGQIVNMEAHEF